MTETPSEAPETQPESDRVKIGNVTVTVLRPSESTLVAINLRYRSASRRLAGVDPNSQQAAKIEYDVVMDVFEDALFGLVPDPEDQSAVIAELSARRVDPRELLNMLLRNEPENRAERRAEARTSRSRTRRGRR